MARRSGPRVGLALSGGGARGMAHIGVIGVLEAEGIPVDIVAGTSAGAVVGALYAQGKNARQLKDIALTTPWQRLKLLPGVTLARSGFATARRFTTVLRSHLDDVHFADLRLPFACVAADIYTGEEIVFREGPVVPAVRASIAIPVIMTAVRWQGRFLVDGGLVNPVPVRMAREMGADVVIAVNVAPDPAFRLAPQQRQKEPGILQVIAQSISVATSHLTRESLAGADVVIEPALGHFGIADFERAGEGISRGEAAALEAVPEIRRRLRL